MSQASITTILRRDVVGTLTLATRREARLLPEHARFYPGVVPGAWESASILADRVLAGGLLRAGVIRWRRRILHDAHFEFRGGGPELRERPMREDR